MSARCLVPAAALLLVACSRTSADGPPPEDRLTVASAAPGALGALAAGSDAAPSSPTRPNRTWAVPGDEAEDEVAEPDELDGGAPDAALPAPPSQDLPAMNPRFLVALGAAAVSFAFGCGHKQLPPGTPPPEYEKPVLPPWPATSASAAPVPEALPPEPALEADAGSVDADAPPASDASPTSQEL